MTIVDVTLNPNDMGTGNNLSNGNLSNSISAITNIRATHGKVDGKWYWEYKLDSGNQAVAVGISNKLYPIGSTANTGSSGDVLNIRAYNPASSNSSVRVKYPEGTFYGKSITVGTVIGVALDLENFKLEFYVNGVSQGVSHENLSTMGEVFPLFKSTTTNIKTFTANFGKESFVYDIPQGFLPYNVYPDNKILLLSNEKTYSIESEETKHETKMTSDTTPSPYVASASGVLIATYSAWKAFNGTNINNSDGWATNSTKTGWIQIDYGIGKKSNILYITNRNNNTDNSYLTSSPKDFKILGSNDGKNYDVLSIVENVTDWTKSNETKKFEFDNSKPYRYYKLDVLSNNGGGTIIIGELLFSYKEDILYDIGYLSEQNLIKYGMDSPVQVDGIFTNKNYILQDTVSKDVDGLWKKQLDRKPLSIGFN